MGKVIDILDESKKNAKAFAVEFFREADMKLLEELCEYSKSEGIV